MPGARALPLACAAWLLAGCGERLPDTDAAVYLGDAGRTHYSPLTQIDRDNVASLEPAWVYDTNEFGDGVSTMYTSPLVVDGVLYGLSPRLNAFALDAATGAELWRFDVDATGGIQRGLTWWRGQGRSSSVLRRGARSWWLSMRRAEHPQPVSGRGDDSICARSRAESRSARRRPQSTFENLLLVGLDPERAAGGFGSWRLTSVTGNLAWRFPTRASAGVGMALDRERALLFVPTGPPIPEHLGRDRPGGLSDALLALDARTGKPRWQRQLVRDGLRGRELTAPPTLVEVLRAGAMVDGVALPSRSGSLFLFDRDTGGDLYETRDIAAPASTIPGEQATPLHTVSTVTLTRPAFAVTTRDEHATMGVESDIAGLVRRPFAPPSVAGTLLFPGVDGGVGWGGAAYDPARRKLIVNTRETASVLRLLEIPAGFSAQDAYLAHCARCHGVDRKGLHPDRQDRYGAGGPSLAGIGERFTKREIEASIVRGRGAMQPLPEVGALHRMAIVEYLVSEPDYRTYDERTTEATYAAIEPVTLRDADGLPGSAPPWGSLVALDLDTGSLDWQAPLGSYPGHPAPGFGAENAGGPLLTASGLVFVGSTPDGTFRAWDAADGTLLWQARPRCGRLRNARDLQHGRQAIRRHRGRRGDSWDRPPDRPTPRSACLTEASSGRSTGHPSRLA